MSTTNRDNNLQDRSLKYIQIVHSMLEWLNERVPIRNTQLPFYVRIQFNGVLLWETRALSP